MCSQIASSESFKGKSCFKVRDANVGADCIFISSRVPSMRTRLSKGWVRNLGSMSGFVLGSRDCNVTEPFDWGFMTRQMAPKYCSCSVGSYERKDDGECYVRVSISIGSNQYLNILLLFPSPVRSVLECALGPWWVIVGTQTKMSHLGV